MSPSHARRYQRGPHLFQRKRGGSVIWYAYIPGRSKGGQSLGTSDHAIAAAKLRDIIAGRLDATDAGAAPREAAITSVVDAWMDAPHGYTRRTKQTHGNRLLAFVAWCHEHEVSMPHEITSAKLDEWVKAREKIVARRTINRDLRVVRRVLAWGSKSALCAANAAVAEYPALREPKRGKRHVVPDPDEMRKILAALGELHPGACAAVMVIYATGRRIEELRRLTAFDVHDGAMHVRPEAGPAATAEPGKGYDSILIPIAPEVERMCMAFFAWRAGPRTACSEAWLLRKLHDACDRARVPRCGLHDLRRAFATEAVNHGVQLRVVSRWLGHKDLQTTERYIAEYRSDAAVRAPIPRGLTADSRLKDGAGSGRDESGVHVNGRTKGRRK